VGRIRIVRILLVSCLVLILISGAAVGIVYRNEAALIRIILARIDSSTGYNIVPAGVGVSFRSHLQVTLERPRVYKDSKEVAHLADVRVLVSYHQILTSNGLPLRDLRLDGLVARVPPAAAVAAGYTIPRPGVAGMHTVLRALQAIGEFSSRITLYNAELEDPAGQTIIDHFNLVASREHRRILHSPWLVNYDGYWRYSPLGGFHLSGAAHLETAKQAVTGVLWSGVLWFWDLNLNLAAIHGVAFTGAIQGKLRVVLEPDGTVNGQVQAGVRDGIINGRAFVHPLALGSFSLLANYDVSQPLFRLYRVQVTQSQNPVLSGSCTITNPYDPKRRADLRISGIKVSTSQLASYLQAIRATPRTLINAAKRIDSGSLAIEQAQLGPQAPISDWTLAIVRDNLKLSVIIRDAGFDLTDPALPNLPPVRHFEAGVIYRRGSIQITQGSAVLGQSSFSEINGQARVAHAPRWLPYSVRFKSILDFGELYTFAAPMLKQRAPQISGRIENIQGSGALWMQASGSLKDLAWSEPHDYRAVLEPNRIQFGIKGIPQRLGLVTGKVIVTRGQVQIDNLLAAPSNHNGGDVLLNGTVVTGAASPIVHHLTVELHQLRADQWVPLLVSRDDLSVDGELGGKLTANSDPSGDWPPVITGVVTLSHGQVQPGFMRSPMIVSTGSLSLDGKGLVFNLPAALLEGHPMDFKLTLADFAHPALKIDASLTSFDFEVLRFIRLPWSPKTPVNFFPLPVSGHVEAVTANFDKLQMSNVSTDFSRANDHWLVNNFKANSLGGKIALNVSGVSANEWINARGSVTGINTASIGTLMDESHPALSGALDGNFNIWGNTDTDFFHTLNGTISLQVSHGLVRRLALLTRILSFINLKNWLTAHLPNPRIAGVPFDTITADFKGHNGNMYTGNFRLNGPLMLISAKGNLNLGENTMNMEIGLIPFVTYNWLLTKIPLVGKNIAEGTDDLLAAYFHVYGPFANPKVIPKPITSVAEFLAKTLSLPINIIRPNTINP